MILILNVQICEKLKIKLLKVYVWESGTIVLCCVVLDGSFTRKITKCRNEINRSDTN